MQKFAENMANAPDTTSIEHRAAPLTVRAPSVSPHCLGNKLSKKWHIKVYKYPVIPLSVPLVVNAVEIFYQAAQVDVHCHLAEVLQDVRRREVAPSLDKLLGCRGRHSTSWYPLVMTNIAMVNGPLIDDFPSYKPPFIGDSPWLC